MISKVSLKVWSLNSRAASALQGLEIYLQDHVLAPFSQKLTASLTNALDLSSCKQDVQTLITNMSTALLLTSNSRQMGQLVLAIIRCCELAAEVTRNFEKQCKEPDFDEDAWISLDLMCHRVARELFRNLGHLSSRLKQLSDDGSRQTCKAY